MCTHELPLPRHRLFVCWGKHPGRRLLNALALSLAGDMPVTSSHTSAFTPPSSVAPKKVFFSAYRVVLRSGRVSDDMAVILRKMIMTLRRKMNDPLKEMCKLCSGKRERSDGTLCRAQSPCSAWCRQSSRCSPSLTGRLSASLSLGHASTRRSPATSGRC